MHDVRFFGIARVVAPLAILLCFLSIVLSATVPWYLPTYGLAYLLISWGWHPVFLFVLIGIMFTANSWALLRVFRWAPDNVIAVLGAIEGVVIGFGLIGQDFLWGIIGASLGGVAGYFLLRRIAQVAKAWRGFERIITAEAAILTKLRKLSRSSSEFIAQRLDRR